MGQVQTFDCGDASFSPTPLSVANARVRSGQTGPDLRPSGTASCLEISQSLACALARADP